MVIPAVLIRATAPGALILATLLGAGPVSAAPVKTPAHRAEDPLMACARLTFVSEDRPFEARLYLGPEQMPVALRLSAADGKPIALLCPADRKNVELVTGTGTGADWGKVPPDAIALLAWCGHNLDGTGGDCSLSREEPRDTPEPVDARPEPPPAPPTRALKRGIRFDPTLDTTAGELNSAQTGWAGAALEYCLSVRQPGRVGDVTVEVRAATTRFNTGELDVIKVTGDGKPMTGILECMQRLIPPNRDGRAKPATLKFVVGARSVNEPMMELTRFWSVALAEHRVEAAADGRALGDFADAFSDSLRRCLATYPPESSGGRVEVRATIDGVRPDAVLIKSISATGSDLLKPAADCAAAAMPRHKPGTDRVGLWWFSASWGPGF